MVILGLGSNIGDRLAYLSAATARISLLLQDMRFSRVLESVALLPPGAPPEWGHPFLNMAVSGVSTLSPQALLGEIKAIERDAGRIARYVWSPREIDIDILTMDGVVVDSPELAVPHRELLNRDFALLPLAELVPEWRYPLAGQYSDWRAADIIADKGFVLGKNLRDTGLAINV